MLLYRRPQGIPQVEVCFQPHAENTDTPAKALLYGWALGVKVETWTQGLSQSSVVPPKSQARYLRLAALHVWMLQCLPAEGMGCPQCWRTHSPHWLPLRRSGLELIKSTQELGRICVPSLLLSKLVMAKLRGSPQSSAACNVNLGKQAGIRGEGDILAYLCNWVIS